MSKKRKHGAKELSAKLASEAEECLPVQQAIIFERITEEVGNETFVTCPVCGHRDDLESFDCMGLPDDHIWCNNCDTELS